MSEMKRNTYLGEMRSGCLVHFVPMKIFFVLHLEWVLNRAYQEKLSLLAIENQPSHWWKSRSISRRSKILIISTLVGNFTNKTRQLSASYWVCVCRLVLLKSNHDNIKSPREGACGSWVTKPHGGEGIKGVPSSFVLCHPFFFVLWKHSVKVNKRKKFTNFCILDCSEDWERDWLQVTSVHMIEVSVRHNKA